MARAPRKTKSEQQQERYKLRLAMCQQSVRYELERGNIHAALRMVSGLACDHAGEIDEVMALESLAFKAKERLTLADHQKIREAFKVAMLHMAAVITYFKPEEAGNLPAS